jgi:hypothetical protein
MDLLACSRCVCRFYVPGVAASDGQLCPQCGADLALAVHGLTSIPLDARWLDPQAVPAPEITMVELRGKRERTVEDGEQIVRDLAGYFPVTADGRSVHVSVNRGAASDAALRVAAVLDGVDSGWEEHFYLPASGSDARPDHLPAPTTRRGNLRLVPRAAEGAQQEGWA